MCVCVCVCVCACVCVRAIKQYRHPLSTHFYIHPFESPYRFYGIRRELVNKPSMINRFPSTFCPILGYHQEWVYCKSDVTFTGALLLYYYIIIYTGVLL